MPDAGRRLQEAVLRQRRAELRLLLRRERHHRHAQLARIATQQFHGSLDGNGIRRQAEHVAAKRKQSVVGVLGRRHIAGVKGVDFLAVNTDVQALHYNKANSKIHIGKSITRGLGAGMNPELGKQSAEESQNDIRDALKEADMVFVTCGLGGGTGTGAAPIVAEIARDLGALTVAVVTKPFAFEGAQRHNIAERGLTELSDKVDTIITIPNDKLLQVIDKKTSLLDAFSVVDDILQQGVAGIAELITVPGLINVDFADVKAVMSNAGSALMGIGQASGENKAIEAAKAAHAHEFIMQLPQGYDTMLGKNGMALSGGQLQRLAIARAILRNPRILILDEATSQVDSESEAKIKQALQGLMKGRTTFVIAHRLSTILSADMIVVMEAGSIIAVGNHDQLLSGCALYRRLYETQFRQAG